MDLKFELLYLYVGALLYNKDKEKVLIEGYLETATWYPVLAQQQGSQHYKLCAMSRKDGF